MRAKKPEDKNDAAQTNADASSNDNVVGLPSINKRIVESAIRHYGRKRRENADKT